MTSSSSRGTGRGQWSRCSDEAAFATGIAPQTTVFEIGDTARLGHRDLGTVGASGSLLRFFAVGGGRGVFIATPIIDLVVVVVVVVVVAFILFFLLFHGDPLRRYRRGVVEASLFEWNEHRDLLVVVAVIFECVQVVLHLFSARRRERVVVAPPLLLVVVVVGVHAIEVLHVGHLRCVRGEEQLKSGNAAQGSLRPVDGSLHRERGRHGLRSGEGATGISRLRGGPITCGDRGAIGGRFACCLPRKHRVARTSQFSWQQFRIRVAEELDQRTCGHHHASLTTLILVLDQVAKKRRVHPQRLPAAHFADGVESDGNRVRTRAVVDEAIGDRLDE